MEDLTISTTLAIIPTLACIYTFAANKTTPYDGAQVLKIYPLPKSDPASPVLQALLDNGRLLDLFSRSPEGAANVMVCREQSDFVQRILERFNIPYEIKVYNMGRQVMDAEIGNSVALARTSGMNWKAYHSLETIQAWMDNMARENPQHVAVETYGKSFRNRDMKVMKISSNINDFGTTRPAVWIDGGIHAREWITPATTTYIANEVIKTVKNDAVGRNSLISKFDWYFMPVLNPDGYEFSRTVLRLWRKTLSINFPKFWCVGADPNRNWDFHWGERGASSIPCADDYRGRSPASESEVASSQQYILSKKDHIRLYITLHSYSQILSVPWSYDNVVLEDEQDLLPLAKKAAENLEKVHGTKYQVGSFPELLYAASGDSSDWAKGAAGIKFSYAFELRPGSDSFPITGFLLPPVQIIPTGEETFVAVETLAQGVFDYYTRIRTMHNQTQSQ